MFRTIGFLIGFSLASIGLLFLVDAGSALRMRDTAWGLIQRMEIGLPMGLVSRNRETLAAQVSSQDTTRLPTRTIESEAPPLESHAASVEQPPEEKPHAERSAARPTQPTETTPAAASAPGQATASVQSPLSVQVPTQVQTLTPAQAPVTEQAMPPRQSPVPIQPLAAVVQTEDTSAKAAPIDTEPVPARHWYVFWSPFATEYAANGFAERLMGLTGLDFTVIREGPGEYQVAFAYADENERSAGLAMIETQTGLRLRTPNP